jgi:TRAP-type C4-dicarboxylate transport system permease small subunit
MMRRIVSFLESCAILFLLLMAGFVILQVLTRNFLSQGLPEAEEFARFFSIMVIFLVIPILLEKQQHVKVDFFTNMLPERAQDVLARISNLATVLFCAGFIYSGALFISRAWKFKTPAAGIPNWMFYTPVFIGLFLMGAIALRNAFAIRSPRPTAPEDRP